MSLNFHKEAFKQILENDGLLVIAKGLGLHKILQKLLLVYCKQEYFSEDFTSKDSKNKGKEKESEPQKQIARKTIFVLNIPTEEQYLFLEELSLEGIKNLPVIITNQTHTERLKLYLTGGVFFVSSRVLVVDLLNKRIPSHIIAGILVNNAERVHQLNNDGFILRLFREQNHTGFIKAFSEYPEGFVNEFAKLEKSMKSLFVSKIFLWPRFAKMVQQDLSAHVPEVVELFVPMSEKMKGINFAIENIIKGCLGELKKVPNIENSNFTLENGLLSSFDNILMQQFDPIWNKLGKQTKQITHDLRILRRLLNFVVNYDCVSYNRFLEHLTATELGSHSSWVFTEEANLMYKLSKERVFIKQDESPKKKQKLNDENQKDKIEFIKILETNPKWELLSQVLDEIEQESANLDENEGRILILTADDRTCVQLQEYLKNGSKKMLDRLYNDYINSKKNSKFVQNFNDNTGVSGYNWFSKKHQNNINNSKNNNYKSNFRGRGRSMMGRPKKSNFNNNNTQKKNSHNVTQLTKDSNNIISLSVDSVDEFAIRDSQISDFFDIDTNLHQNMMIDLTQFELDKINENSKVDFEEYFNILPSPYIVIHPSGRKELLEQIKPTFVILYDPDVNALRYLEVYKSEHPGVALRVYFLMYEDSVEHKKWTTIIEKEKQSFVKLIEQKASMIPPKYITENQNETKKNENDDFEQISSTRKAGGKFENLKNKKRYDIIVDTREFGSSLPSALHLAKFNPIAITLEIEKWLFDRESRKKLYLAKFNPIAITLEIGDYILTPEICIERKSIPDLIGSFKSGRVFKQIEAMMKNYRIPILLIEFDLKKSFSLINTKELSEEISTNTISSKIVLLTLHFPKLRLIWCHGEKNTVKMFDILKSGKPEPDANTVNQSVATENVGAHNFLSKLPGITEHNIKLVKEKVKNLKELSEKTEEELYNILKNKANAKKLHQFLNY